MASIGNHTFIDGVGDIRLRDGIIRMDMLALSPTRRDEAGNPVPQFIDQLVMSPPAFLRMVAALGQTMKQLQEQGMLRQPGDGDAPAAANPIGEPAAEKPKAGGKKGKRGKGKSGSPNF